MDFVRQLLDDDDDDAIIAAACAAAVAHQRVISIAAVAAASSSVGLMDAGDEEANGGDEDHRKRKRTSRRYFFHDQALRCILRDYLCPNALFGREFPLMFRISRARFQVLMEDVMAAEIGYYENGSASLEAKLLLPLKTLAYGVASHCFCDYFQMSAQLARDCCKVFDSTIKLVYGHYLKLPTKKDMKSICTLHKNVHKVEGMLGSLDCTHTYWKNCPKAWAGSYKGKEDKPSIVLEGLCDHHCFFWHLSYGYAGTLNDISILNLSPFLERLIDGSYDSLERESGVVPFKIENEVFEKTFILVDGIYPQYSRFVKGIKEPITEEEKRYTSWQEGARKDIERAFGILKSCWQFMSRPIHLMNIEDLGRRVQSCLILHNILVSDRIMDLIGADYDAAFSLESDFPEVEHPMDLLAIQGVDSEGNVIGEGDDSCKFVGNPVVGELVDHPASVIAVVSNNDRWKLLKNKNEHERLFLSLKKKFST